MGKIYNQPWWMYSFESPFWGTCTTSAVDQDGHGLPRIEPKILTQIFINRFGRPPRDGDKIRIDCWCEREHRIYNAIGVECPCEWKHTFQYQDR